MNKVYNQRYFVKATHLYFLSLFISLFPFFLSRKFFAVDYPTHKKYQIFCRYRMCFLSVDLKLQMFIERLLLAIVSVMIFQIFEAFYINC